MRHLRAAVASLGRLRTWREILLTAGAVLGVVCIGFAVATVGFGVKPLVFQSGSMAPAITTGSLAFARSVPAPELRVGDVVSVEDARGVRITHRIAGLDARGSQAALTLKGDANDVPDAATYVVRSADRVAFAVPGLGYVVSWASGPIGTFAGGLFVALILVVAFRRPARDPRPGGDGPDVGPTGPGAATPSANRHERDEPPRSDHGVLSRSWRFASGGRRAARAGRMALVVGAGVALLGGTVMNPAVPTQASWVNAATARSTFTTYTVPKPVIGCSQTGNVIIGYTITMSWPATSTPYAITYTARIVQNNRVLTVPPTGATRSVQITSGLLGSIVGDTATLEVKAALPGSTTWVTLGSHDFTTGLLGLTFDCKGASY